MSALCPSTLRCRSPNPVASPSAMIPAMTLTRLTRQVPDRAAALAQYRRRAGFYDLELALFEPLRRQAIECLALQPGEVVLDVGCGTGLSLALLSRAIGKKGCIIGIEQSPEMIEQARQRVAQRQLPGVTLLNSPVASAALAVKADAALFHFTHDILRQPAAVAHVLHHLKPGARVVAAGLKWAPTLCWPVNLLVLPTALYSVTSTEGLAAPWDRLSEHLDDFKVASVYLGGAYLASGVRKPTSRRP